MSEQDEHNKSEDRRKRMEKFKYLTTYRDENKQVLFLSFEFKILKKLIFKKI